MPVNGFKCGINIMLQVAGLVDIACIFEKPVNLTV